MPVRRVDANQRAIVAALRKAGAVVQVLSEVGHGCPDLLASYAGANYLLECKSPGGKLTDDQIKWLDKWCGPVAIVHGPQEAITALGIPQVGIERAVRPQNGA